MCAAEAWPSWAVSFDKIAVRDATHRTPYSTALWRDGVYVLYCVTAVTLALARSSPCFASQEARVALLQQQADELEHVMDALQRAAGENFDISKVTALLIETASALPFSCRLV